MKKKLSVILSFVALFAFLTINVAEAQSPKKDKKATKVEQTVEKKAVEPCCESKGQAAAVKPGCCTSSAKAEASEASGTQVKTGCASAGKTCGGCSSKTSVQSAEQLPVPKR